MLFVLLQNILKKIILPVLLVGFGIVRIVVCNASVVLTVVLKYVKGLVADEHV